MAILRTSFSDNLFLTSTVKSVHITYPAHLLATLSQNTALISTRRWCSLLTFFCYQEHRKSIVNFIVDMSVFNKSDTSVRLNINVDILSAFIKTGIRRITRLDRCSCQYRDGVKTDNSSRRQQFYLLFYIFRDELKPWGV